MHHRSVMEGVDLRGVVATGIGILIGGTDRSRRAHVLQDEILETHATHGILDPAS